MSATVPDSFQALFAPGNESRDNDADADASPASFAPLLGDDGGMGDTTSLDYLPPVRRPELREYPRHQLASSYNRSGDAEQIAHTYTMTGMDKAETIARAKTLYEKALRKDIADIGDMPEDPQSIAKSLGVDVRSVNMISQTDAGRERLKGIWRDKRIETLTEKRGAVYDGYLAAAFDADDAVLLAEFKRGLDDDYGGTITRGYNLAADAAKSLGGTLASGSLYVAEKGLRLADYASEYTRQPYVEPTDYKGAIKRIEEQQRLSKSFYHIAQARTGDFFYDDILQPLAQGIGSVGAFMLTGALGRAASFAMMWGTSASEVRDAMRAENVDESTANLVADLTAIPAALLEYTGIEGITKSIKAYSPGGKWLLNWLKGSFSEAWTEGSQSVVGNAGVEIGKAIGQKGYKFDLAGFLNKTLREAMRDAFYGGLTGGVVSGAGGGPGRAAYDHVEWSNAHRMLQNGKDKLSRAKILRTNPEKGRTVVESILNEIKAPKVMYQSADEINARFQGDKARLNDYLAKVDVTQEEFQHAIDSGADIQISTGGLLRQQSEADSDPELMKLAKTRPDAPTMGVVAEREMAKREMAEEFSKLQAEDKALPEPFRVFREQMTAAGHDAAYADFLTRVLLAGSNVAGKRMNLTAEQFLNLNPIQTILSGGLDRMKSYDEIATRMQDRIFNREGDEAARAWEAEKTKPSKARELVPLKDGVSDYGFILSEMIQGDDAKAAALVEAPIRLERGNRRFGLVHMEGRHSRDFESAGFGSVQEFVSHVAMNFEQILEGDQGRLLLVTRNAERQLLVVELRKGDDQYYTAITGYVRPTAKRLNGKVLWEKSPASPRSADSSAHPRTIKADTAIVGSQDGIGDSAQSTLPTDTLPSDSASVKAWDDDAIKTILKQSGVAQEHMAALAEYANHLIKEGGEIPEAGQLAKELTLAMENAEGLEQAAEGMGRVLAKPEEITQAVFDAMGIEAESVQEGIAAIRERMEALQKDAVAWREFHKSPEGIRRIREQTDRSQNERGNVTFLPHGRVIRLFNGRQDKSTVLHELFHIFEQDLEKAAKKGNASTADMQDYQKLNESTGGLLSAADEKTRIAGEEKLALMWEKYLMEGVAPSPELSTAFGRFRAKLTEIYRGVKSMVGIELSDDVRGAFERLLASEEEIERARKFYNEKEQFAADALYPTEARAELKDKADKARRTAEEIHLAKIQREYLRAMGGRKALRPHAEAEVKQMRQYRTIDALKDMGGILRADVDEEIGAAKAEEIFRNHRGVIRESVKEGRGPADLAKVAVDTGYANQREMIQAIVDADPHNVPTDVYQAVSVLRKAGGIDELYLIENHGPDAANRLRDGYGNNVIEHASGKIGAVIIAERMGCDSLRSMLDDVAASKKKVDAVTARLEEMIKMHEAEVREIAAQDVATEADEAYHNEGLSDYFASKQRVLDAEAAAQALRDGRKADRMLSDRAMREAAVENVAKLTGRKAGQYHVFVEAFKRHGQNLIAAEKRGDSIVAARELRFQRMAHYSIREALDARHELDRFQKHYLSHRIERRLDGGSGHPKIEFAFREAIKDILTAFKVTDSARFRPDQATEGEVNIPAYEAGSEVEMFLPALSEAIPEWIRKREGADKLKSWKDLTLAKIRELDEAVRTLEKTGHGALDALAHGKNVTHEMLKRDSINRMKDRPDRPKIYSTKTTWGKFMNFLDRIGVETFVPESILAMADGNTNIRGMGIGPLQAAARRLVDCEAKKKLRLNKAYAELTPAMQTLQAFRKRFNNDANLAAIPVPESLRTGRDVSAWDAELVLMVALNSGNAGNVKALLEGYGIDEGHWRTIASSLTEKEWDAVQKVWDVIGGFYPEIDAVTFKQINKHVKKEQAAPFTVVTFDGIEKVIDGGYFPLVFDPLADPDFGNKSDVEKALIRAYANAIHGHAKTADGFVKSREIDDKTGEAVVRRPPLLQLDIITTHLNKVAHYVTHAEAVREFDRLTLDAEWSETFQRKFGEAYYRNIREWIKHLANPDARTGTNSEFGKTLEWLRHKATTAALGLRVMTGLKQRWGYIEAATHMTSHSRTRASGAAYLLKGMRAIGWAGNAGVMNQRIQEIYKASAYMAARDGNVTVDMREMIDKAKADARVYEIAGHEFTANDVNNAFFAWIQMNDRAAACAVWWGAFQMAKDGNGDFDVKGMDADTLKREAVRFADMAAATQASSFEADLTKLQRDRGVARLFTSFISGNIRRWGMRTSQYWDAMRMGHITKGEFLENFIKENAFQAWIPAFMAMAARSLAGDDDEPSAWDFFSTLFLDPVITVAEGVPGLNMIGSINRYGKSAAAPPALAKFGESVVRAGKIPGLIGEGEYGKAVTGALGTAGYALGIPAENLIKDGVKFGQTIGVIDSNNKKGK